MIQVRNLTKRYGPVLAVDDVSFDVDEGGVTGFLGPNGAGKTTTIRILSCYQPATSGTATVGGFDVFSHSIEVRRRVGYLPESAPLYPEMRTREYLSFRARLRGMGPSERASAIRRVSERCWLGEFIDRPIGHLSKGMRQRVGLADALLHDPPVLILDEPTVGLDPNQIRETRHLIQDLGAHHTVLLSSHILHEVEQTCTKAIIIAGGRIVASGSPRELREQFAARGRVVAEVQAPRKDLEAGVKGISGVRSIDVTTDDGWLRLAVDVSEGRDVREDLYRLVAAKGWGLREIRREGPTLEDFFVQVTAAQVEQTARR
jgi:ABC-2 type transport system ATP-binding protein